MPYIICKDGQNYSRYDNSEYVQNCIALEKQEIIEQSIACGKSQECIDRHETSNIVLSGLIAIILVSLAVMTYKFCKICKDMDTAYRQETGKQK